MRCNFDTWPCRSGGGMRELEILRELGATPPLSGRVDEEGTTA